MGLHISENQSCTLTFTHVNGQPAKLYIAKNPLTDSWMEIHYIGEANTCYVSTYSGAMSLANKIVKISNEKGLPCEVEIKTVEKS